MSAEQAGQMTKVYLGLGGNQGDRLAYLHSARAALPPAVSVRHVSRVYETEPWGYTAQPAFLNQVLEAQTSMTPLALLAYIKQIERLLGRQANFRYGPRVIDIDILLYGDEVYSSPELSIPHPRLAERVFALAPLAELAPTLRHPQLGKTMAELLAEVGLNGVRALDE